MDVNDCLVSIIVPVYNVERYIAQCITSVLAQTYQKFELILVDDGSKDKSGEICDFYAKQDKRILVFHNANQGVSAARNFGIEHASGSRLCFVDSDDWVDTTYLSDMLKYADYDFVIQGMKQNKNEIKYQLRKFENNKDLFNVFISIALKHETLFNAPVCRLFKLDIINNNKIRFDQRLSLGEDLMFNLTYMCYIRTSCITNTCSYNYRVNEGSLTHIYVPIKKMLDKSNTIKEVSDNISKRLNNREIYDVIMSSQIEELLRRTYRHKSPRKDRSMAFTFFKKNGNSRNIKYMRKPYSEFRIFLHLPFSLADFLLVLLFKILNKIKPAQLYSNS